MDETLVTVDTCPTCRHKLAPAVRGELTRHMSVDCGQECCSGFAACFTCREPFCTCPVH